MSPQRSILSFFKPGVVTPLRNALKESNSPCKRFKSYSNESSESVDKINNDIDENESKQSGSNILTGNEDVSSKYFTSEERKLIEKKHMKARLKLVSKKYPILDPDIGVTWFPALENEINKPYFKKVRIT